MTADTLKFGPEWLRNLSDGSNNSSAQLPPVPTTKYKLADHRYGREEMLALYAPEDEIPETLNEFPSILVEKPQNPLVYVPLTDEEQQILSQSVNSVAVLRVFGRGAPVIRGRGGLAERGRGRARGRGEYIARAYEEGDPGAGVYGRGRGTRENWEEGKYYDRSISAGVRGGYDDQPGRKEFMRSNSENWRRDRPEEEIENGAVPPSVPTTTTTITTNPNEWRRAGNPKDKWKMPEWSFPGSEDMGDPGTFDSSGAFVSTKFRNMQRPNYKENQDEGDAKGPSSVSSEETKAPDIKEEDEDTNHRGDNSQSGSKEPRGFKFNKDSQSQPQERGFKFNKEPEPNERGHKFNKEPESNQRAFKFNKTMDSNVPGDGERSSVSPQPSPSTTKRENKMRGGKVTASRETAVPDTAVSNSSAISNKKVKAPQVESCSDSSKRKSEAETLDDMKITAENVASMISDISDAQDAAEIRNAGRLPDLVPSGPVSHEDTTKWVYKDPQGVQQGPFTISEMAEWFSAGYFTMNLLVKRCCDDRFQTLGETIKKWGRVPFSPGPAPPPMKNPVLSGEDHLKKLQQQHERLLQQQAVQQQQQVAQQQQLLRQLQIQQVFQKLQEQEGFKNLPLLQQQHLAMQLLAAQPQLLPPDIPLPQTITQPEATQVQTLPGYQRPLSQTSGLTEQKLPDDTSIWGSIMPNAKITHASTPEADISKSFIFAADLEAHIEHQRKVQEMDDKRKKEEGEQQKLKEALRKKEEEIRKQQEEIQREMERMQRESQELEKKRNHERQKRQEEERKEDLQRRQEDIQRQEQELKRIEEEKLIALKKLREERRLQKEEDLRRQEKEKKKLEEERKREEQRIIEEKRKEEIERKKELKRQEELRQKEALLKQQAEEKRQREVAEIALQRQKEEEEKQRQMELQIKQEQQMELQRQQQEALKRLQQQQQEHLANLQLPSTVHWAASQNGSSSPTKPKTMQEIQAEDQREQEHLRQLDERQRQAQALLDMERQQQFQQQQQQAKTWSTQVYPPTYATSTSSLKEIQEDEQRQLEKENKERQEQQQTISKNLPLNTATVWGSGQPPTGNSWAADNAWGSVLKSNVSTDAISTANNLGFWDDAIVAASKKPPTTNKTSKPTKGSAEFPALVNTAAPKSNNSSSNKSKSAKTKKEEETVQKLFQAPKPADEFMQWCEVTLQPFQSSVHIPTFIAFLQDIDSPYEVHDYVKSYLGESKAAQDFAQQFVDRRSQKKKKVKQAKKIEEDSIWGPAPAVNPRETRQSVQNSDLDGQKSKGGKKKQKKGQKMDSNLLGFSVQANPDRINIGEIDSAGH